MKRIGRPPKVEGQRRRSVGLSLSNVEADALRELAELRGESQGAIVGRFVLQALERERRKRTDS